jgi:hypothetical protein
MGFVNTGNGKPEDLTSNGNGQANLPNGQPVRRDQYLHRFCSDAILQVVEVFTAEDGSERKRSRLCRWPGL